MSAAQLQSATFVAAVFVGYLAAFMLVPAAADLYAGNDDWRVFAFSAFFLGGLATAIALATNVAAPPVSTRYGFLLVNLLWVATALAGAVPFMAASIGLDFADAVFESMSALTTTGSTVIVGLDDLPPGLLLWRSFLQWIGGIGVIALGLFVLPFLRIGGVSYLKIESSGIDERPFARFSNYTVALVAIYAILTVLCAIAYEIAGMTGFDAINHAMSTLSTGGFSTHDSSFGHYSDKPAVLWVGTFFMFVGALPFSILILLALRGRPDALRDPQIGLFAAYTAVLVLAVAVYFRLSSGVPFSQALTHSAFNLVSIITTTGYASDDYSLWGPFAVGCAFVATFMGGCSGSTSGGIKAYRFLVMFKLLENRLRALIYPSVVHRVRYGDRPVDADMQSAVVLFISAFFALWALFTLLLTATGLDLVTATSGALTGLTNVGPGLGATIGPAGNFASLGDAAKWLLTLAMLIGRLEVLAVLVLLSPVFWRG